MKLYSIPPENGVKNADIFVRSVIVIYGCAPIFFAYTTIFLYIP